MTSPPTRRGLGPASWLLLILALMLTGAAAAVWGLSRWQAAASFFGIARPAAPPASPRAAAMPQNGQSPAPALPVVTPPAGTPQLALLEARIARLENATQQVAGSAGRADALLISFAARRAVDRGVPLGYLEPLLSERFGQTHRQAVAALITGARTPVRLDQLVAEFEQLGPQLQGAGPDVGLWDATRRELASLVAIRRADRPNPRPSATYERARSKLQTGQVDQALAEAMRLPGIARAAPWVARARRYVAVHRALDEIESAALLAR